MINTVLSKLAHCVVIPGWDKSDQSRAATDDLVFVGAGNAIR
jgi:hypothetical protein